MIKKESKHFIFDHPQKINAAFIVKLIITVIQSAFYKTMICFLPKSNCDKKYFVSICGIFKNEGSYLKEWIEYHRVVGVDHIYLYNNQSTDVYLKAITLYIESGYVTLVQWEHDHQQMEAYKDYVARFGNESNWIGFIDLDEFVVPVEDNDIKDFFKKYKNRPSILIYWRMFGTNGMIDRDLNSLVTESFYSCWNKYDDIGRCFLNTNYAISGKQEVFNHMLWNNYKGINLPPVNCCDKVCVRSWFNKANRDVLPIQINHYVLKSYKEYLEKTQKTDAFFQKNPKESEHFKRHEELCTSVDYKIKKYIIALKIAMKSSTVK